MFDYIMEFLNNHYWTVSYALSYSLGIVCSITILTRFVRMFPTYIKTGSLGNDCTGLFFANNNYRDIHGIDFIKCKTYDFFTSTHPQTFIMDTISCGLIIGALHMGWILFLVIVLGAIFLYSIVKFVQYLRKQHVKKEEFHSALRGE